MAEDDLKLDDLRDIQPRLLKNDLILPQDLVAELVVIRKTLDLPSLEASGAMVGRQAQKTDMHASMCAHTSFQAETSAVHQHVEIREGPHDFTY